MQSDCAGPAGHDSDHFQSHEEPSLAEWSARLGTGHQPMGSVLATRPGLFLSICVFDCLLGLLERRASSR
jgi:hypothetical protein